MFSNIVFARAKLFMIILSFFFIYIPIFVTLTRALFSSEKLDLQSAYAIH